MIYKIQSEFFYNTCLSRIMDLITVTDGDKKSVAKGILDKYIQRTILHINLVCESSKLLADHYCETTGVDKETFFKRISNHDSDKLNNEDTIVYYSVACEKKYGTPTTEWDCGTEVMDRWENVEWPKHWERHAHHVPEHFGRKEDGVWRVDTNVDRYALTEMVADWTAMWLELGHKSPKAWLNQEHGKSFVLTGGDLDYVNGCCELVEHSENQIAAIRAKYNLAPPKEDQSTEALSNNKLKVILRKYNGSDKELDYVYQAQNLSAQASNDDSWTKDEVKKSLAVKGKNAYLLLFDNNVIGACVLCHFDQTKDETPWMPDGYRKAIAINDFAIFKEYQGKGLGYSSMVAIIEHCFRSTDTITLGASPSNTAAVNLYKKLGFKIIKEAKVDGKPFVNMGLKKSEYKKNSNESFSFESFSMESIPAQYQKLVFENNPVKRKIYGMARGYYEDTGSHGYEHIKEVLATAYVLKGKKDLDNLEYTTILYHDVGRGFTDKDEEHNIISEKIARRDLPKTHLFTDDELEKIYKAVLWHRSGWRKDNGIEDKDLDPLSELMANADKGFPQTTYYDICLRPTLWILEGRDVVANPEKYERLHHYQSVDDIAQGVKETLERLKAKRFDRTDTSLHARVFAKEKKLQIELSEKITIEDIKKVVVEIAKNYGYTLPNVSIESYFNIAVENLPDKDTAKLIKQSGKELWIATSSLNIDKTVHVDSENTDLTVHYVYTPSSEDIHHNVEQHIKDNKVYHCSPQKYDKLEIKYMGKWYADKKGIFVTPFAAIASCFIIDKQNILDKLDKEGIDTHDNPINFKYDVWDKKVDELGTMPKHINVTMQGCTGFKPFNGKATGYLYTIDYSKYQDKTSMFKKSETSDVEFIINSDITPEKVEKISVEYTVHPGKAVSKEAFDASKFKPIEIDKNPAPDRFANDTMKINRIDPSTLNQDIIKVLEKQDEYLEIVRRWLTVPDYSLTPKLIEFGKFMDKLYGFDKEFVAYRAMRIGKSTLPIQQSMGIVDNTEIIKKPKPFVVPGYKFTYMNTGPLSVTRAIWVSKVYGDLIVKTKVRPETSKLVITNELAYVLQALDEKYPYYRPLNLSALTEVLLFPDQTLNYQVVTTNGDILSEMPEFKAMNFKDKKIDLDASMSIGEEQLATELIDTKTVKVGSESLLIGDEKLEIKHDYILKKLEEGEMLTRDGVKDAIQPGDIIIPYPKDKNQSTFMQIFHAAERTVYGMSFTSCKLVHEKDTIIGYGVKNKIEKGKSAFDKTSINEFLKYCGGLMILRPKHEIPPTKLKKLHEFMERYYKDAANHDFSYWDATVGTLAYLMNCFQGELDPKKMDPEDYNKMVCSSVVAAGFRWADIDIGLPLIKINRIMPIHMCMSEKLKCVGYWFARGEWNPTIERQLKLLEERHATVSSEALSDAAINTKKKQIIDKICKICDIIDPSKTNSNRYHRILDKMTPKEFNQWMTYVKDGKWLLHIVAPNMVVNLRNENLLKAADAVGAKLFHRIWMTDYNTGRTFLTDNEYLVLPLPIRRQQQFLDEKMSVPEDDKHIDGMTGQVTGDSKSTQITTPEINILAFRGLDTTLEEMVNVRGGNMVAYGEFRKQAEETGEIHMSELDPTTRSRTAVIAQVLLNAMHIENNIV